jgi:colicin import membrane protein
MTGYAWLTRGWHGRAIRVLLALCAWAGAVVAQVAPDLTLQELDRQSEVLSQRRAAINETYAAEHLQCASRFAVTACEQEVDQKRRSALAPLRQQELALKQAHHQRRGESQLARLAEKAAAANSASRQEARSKSQSQQEQREQRAATRSQPPREPQDVRRAAKENQARIQKQQEKARARTETAAAAEGKRAEHEARLREAQEHKANKLRDLEASKATTAKPLPLRP